MSKLVQERGNQPIWTLWARIWAANQAWNLMHKPRLRGPHSHDKIPRTGFCVGSCSSTLVMDLSFWLSLDSIKRIPGRCLTAHYHPILFVHCPSVSLPALAEPSRRGLNDNWICLIGYSPNLAHLPSPHYQPSLPDRTCIVLEEGVGPGTKSVGGPPSRCKVSAPSLSSVSIHAVCFTPTLWNMSCMSFNSLLRNRLFFLLLFVIFPISLRIPVATVSFSSEIPILNYHLWRAGRDRMPPVPRPTSGWW